MFETYAIKADDIISFEINLEIENNINKEHFDLITDYFREQKNHHHPLGIYHEMFKAEIILFYYSASWIVLDHLPTELIYREIIAYSHIAEKQSKGYFKKEMVQEVLFQKDNRVNRYRKCKNILK